MNTNARSHTKNTPSSGESHADSLKSRDEALLRQALEVMEGLFGIPDQWTGAGGGAVAVWRFGGVEPVRAAIAAIKERLK